VSAPARDTTVLAAVLALPGVLMLAELARGEWASELLHPSGEVAARLTIVTLAITPLRILLPSAGWLRWLRRQRRTLGVAAFGYALLHTLLYLVDMETLRNVLVELPAPGIWTGWVAFFFFLVLGVTSNDASVRLLRARWQLLHRTVYVAALFTLVHWVLIHDNAVSAWAHFLPLAGLEAVRVRSLLQTSRGGAG
jgi:sulfoxide reductase heme-binding subunit YedZ